MSSFRSLVGVGRRALQARLDQLRRTLATLGARLQVAVAQAVSQAVEGVVRETFLAALSQPDSIEDASPYGYHHPDEPLRSREEPLWRRQESPWQQPAREPDWRSAPYDPPFRVDEERFAHEEQEEPTAAPARRFPIALTAGLRAAAWWLRRWWGNYHSLAAVAVGLATACLAYLAGPLVETGLSLLETSDQISAVRGLNR